MLPLEAPSSNLKLEAFFKEPCLEGNRFTETLLDIRLFSAMLPPPLTLSLSLISGISVAVDCVLFCYDKDINYGNRNMIMIMILLLTAEICSSTTKNSRRSAEQ